ncbi:hypothetical protein HJG54_33725 [Leptolyngbya sp. NK1-12]|uniref:Uncharacterized protein n=1 Tax=Leptolyngbya sp. NK1-12 TaxID=2547451 RepID=A0AA96WZD9_9CYAN|nr:hypothetical protein HJG54_33725 [Leptolyngbya sp. NK1-12]
MEPLIKNTLTNVETSPTTHKGRCHVPWSDEIWNRIDRAVHDECKRTRVAAKFLPIVPVNHCQLTVPSDTILVGRQQKLSVREADTVELIELVAEFCLTRQQVECEDDLMTAVTLATRAANLLSQAEDIVLFQGRSAIEPGENQHPIFRERKVTVKSGRAGIGLLDAPPADTPNNPQVVPVPVLDSPNLLQRWGENTFGAVARAYSALQGGERLAQAHYGPYALVLHYEIYADTFAPLPTTLIMPADRVARLVTDGFYSKGMHSCHKGMSAYDGGTQHGEDTHFYGTGTLRPNTGLLLSLGGNTADLVVAIDARTEFVTQDNDGDWLFRVFKRFALRLKDRSAVVRLEFASGRPT